MRASLLIACLIFCIETHATSQVSITKSSTGWELTNGFIRAELVRSSDAVVIKSLRREGGAEWVIPATPLLASPDKARPSYRYTEGVVSDFAKGGKQLALRFQSENGALLSIELKLFPTGAVIQTAMQIENRGQHVLLLDPHIDPLFLTLKNPAKGLKPYSSVQGRHGFQSVASVSAEARFYGLAGPGK